MSPPNAQGLIEVLLPNQHTWLNFAAKLLSFHSASRYIRVNYQSPDDIPQIHLMTAFFGGSVMEMAKWRLLDKKKKNPTH